MSTTNLNIRTDKAVKDQAEAIFNELGLSLTTAVNMFLRTVIRENGIPFELKLDVPNEITAKAIKEGKELLSNPKAPKYTSMEALKDALNKWSVAFNLLINSKKTWNLPKNNEMIKENDRVKTLVESEGYKAGLIGVVIFVSPDGKYCDVELWGKDGYPIGVAGYETDKLLIIDSKNY